MLLSQPPSIDRAPCAPRLATSSPLRLPWSRRERHVRRSVASSPNSASPSTAVTSKPAARICRHSVRAKRHFSWKRTLAGIRARCRASAVSHASGRQRGTEHPGAHARPERRGDCDFAVGHIAERAAILTRHRNRASTAALGDHRPQKAPDASGAPRRVGDEVTEATTTDKVGGGTRGCSMSTSVTISSTTCSHNFPCDRVALRALPADLVNDWARRSWRPLTSLPDREPPPRA